MTVKIKIDRKTGKVKKITGNIGQTRANRAAYQLWRGNVEPTRWYKLRRFFKRLFNELSTKAEAAYAYYAVGSPQACEMPFIGIEEHGA